jgi:hypothetical protein
MSVHAAISQVITRLNSGHTSIGVFARRSRERITPGLVRQELMARWMLVCKRSRSEFEHSKIGDTLADYFLPAKPLILPNGLKRECPHCKAESDYQQGEANFRGSKDQRG